MSDAAAALESIGLRGGAAAALAEELGDDERPLAAIKATAEDDITAGTLLLTDRRLLFVKKGLRKQRRESMWLRDIQAVEITGMLTKKLEVKIGGRAHKYDADTLMGMNVNPKGFVEITHRTIGQARGGPVETPPTPAPAEPAPAARDPIAGLERLAALHERGALSDEEFKAAKRTLLGM